MHNIRIKRQGEPDGYRLESADGNECHAAIDKSFHRIEVPASAYKPGGGMTDDLSPEKLTRSTEHPRDTAMPSSALGIGPFEFGGL
ncbi:MAG: hypothetical protein IT419_10880 [Planctomycetes bacterium]|jgi:hypothetical protein|nr:hypothetical protein [Planctomycetota bacterium]